MRKISEILGMPVYKQHSGKQLGEVKELLFDAAVSRLVGLQIQDNAWFSADVTILVNDILAVHDDQIIIRDQEQAESKDCLYHSVISSHDLIGKRMMTDTGRDLGMITDIWVEPRSNTIHSYQLSGSLIEDILEGRDNVMLPRPQTVTDTCVVIPEPDGHIALD